MGSCFNLLFFISMIIVYHCQGCTNDIAPPNYTFSSPNYPNLYPNNLKCTWTVSVAELLQIRITFTDFRFSGWGDQCYDYLEMWDGGSAESMNLFKSCALSLRQFKADNKGTTAFNSSGSMLFLEITTDRFYRRQGFSATYFSIPERSTSTAPAVVSTSADKQSTPSKGPTVLKTTTPQTTVSTTTRVGLFSTSVISKSSSIKTLSITATSPSESLSRISSDTSLLETRPPLDSTLPAQSFIVVATAVPFLLLLSCLAAIGFFFYTKRSKGKSSPSSNDHSSSAPLGRTGTVACYVNDAYGASPQSLYPPPYQSISVTEGSRSSQINTALDERYITNAAYESYEEEGKGNDDEVGSEGSEGEVFNIAYESYDQERKTSNVDDEVNPEGVSNVAYESYTVERNVDNADAVTEERQISNTAYESYDNKNKVPSDGDAEDFDETYQTIDDSQSADDDYAQLRNESENRLEDNIIYEPYNKDE